MPDFVAYYRVSTERQGTSGLGLDAQREAVACHVRGRGEIVEALTEIESGQRDDRPELGRALAACRRRKAVLVIAKLDRLARNVAFISRLLESGVELVCCDMPEANRLTLHILAAVAEHEREAISQRTKAALRQAKARGVRLGNPRPDTETSRAAWSRKAARHRAWVRPLAEKLRREGWSFRQIAARFRQDSRQQI